MDFERSDVDLHITEIADVLEKWEDVAPHLGLSGINIEDIKKITNSAEQRLVTLR